MVVVLLKFLKKLGYGCCPTGILKSLDMIVILLALLKLKDQISLLSCKHF